MPFCYIPSHLIAFPWVCTHFGTWENPCVEGCFWSARQWKRKERVRHAAWHLSGVVICHFAAGDLLLQHEVGSFEGVFELRLEEYVQAVGLLVCIFSTFSVSFMAPAVLQLFHQGTLILRRRHLKRCGRGILIDLPPWIPILTSCSWRMSGKLMGDGRCVMDVDRFWCENYACI